VETEERDELFALSLVEEEDPTNFGYARLKILAIYEGGALNGYAMMDIRVINAMA
jgi:hypothetical protein